MEFKSSRTYFDRLNMTVRCLPIAIGTEPVEDCALAITKFQNKI
jgi:hypothetical protein